MPCAVDYKVQNQWDTGFTAAVTITNNGAAKSSWSVKWAYAGNQRITNALEREGHPERGRRHRRQRDLQRHARHRRFGQLRLPGRLQRHQRRPRHVHPRRCDLQRRRRKRIGRRHGRKHGRRYRRRHGRRYRRRHRRRHRRQYGRGHGRRRRRWHGRPCRQPLRRRQGLREPRVVRARPPPSRAAAASPTSPPPSGSTGSPPSTASTAAWACAPTSTRPWRRRAPASSSSSWSSTTCPAATARPSPPTVSSARPRSTGTRPSTSTRSPRSCPTAKYAGLRIVTIIEPDSLPNLVTNAGGTTATTDACDDDEGQRQLREGRRLRPRTSSARSPNVYNYIDAGHHGWLGWDSNFAPSAQEFYQGRHHATARPCDDVPGFIVNTANYSARQGAQLQDHRHRERADRSASPSGSTGTSYVDEQSYAQALRDKLVAARLQLRHRHADRHLPQRLGRLRPAHRPGRHDQRGHLRQRRPRSTAASTPATGATSPARASASGPRRLRPPGIDAYVWMKPPGESDGASTAIANDEGKGFDRMCDPTYSGNARNGNNLTGALAERAAGRALVLRPVPAADAERLPAAVVTF